MPRLGGGEHQRTRHGGDVPVAASTRGGRRPRRAHIGHHGVVANQVGEVVERLTLDVRAGSVGGQRQPVAAQWNKRAAPLQWRRRDQQSGAPVRQLGVLRLLASLAGGPELARYIEDELGSCSNTTRRPAIRCSRRCAPTWPATATSRGRPAALRSAGPSTTGWSASRICSGARWTTRTTVRH
jgi:hypothetical protein